MVRLPRQRASFLAVAFASVLACGAASFSTAIAGVECDQGDPFLISHTDAYRSPEDIQTLAAWVSQIEDARIRKRVENALAGRVCVNDQDVLRELLRMLKAADGALRAEALNVLTVFPLGDATTPTRNALNDPASRVRIMALAGLLSMCDVAMIDEINRMRRDDPDKGVRKYAKEVATILGDTNRCRPLPRASHR